MAVKGKISFGKGLADFFFRDAGEPEGDAGSETDDEVAAIERALGAAEPVPGSEEEGDEVAKDGTGAIGDDFPTLYTRVGIQNDPNADALLEAFEGMQSMEGNARRTAMGAMVKGMRADTTSVCGTLSKRIRALEVLVRAQTTSATERRTKRSEALGAAKADADVRVDALNAEIRKIEEDLAAQVAGAQVAGAAEDAALRGLQHRVTQETSRLSAINQFFNPTGEE